VKPPDFLKVLPADIGRVGFDGAAVLALVRYVTGLPGETNGRRTVDGEMWWCASRDDIGQALGGVHRDSVRRTLIRLCDKGELLTIPAERFYGDRAQAYRVSDLPLRGSAQGSDLPLRGSAKSITRIRASSSRGSAQTAHADPRNLPVPLENCVEHSVGENGARTDEREPLDVESVPDPVDGPPPTDASEQQSLDVEPVEPAGREVVTQRNGGMDETAGEVIDEQPGPDNLPAVNGKPKSDPRGTRLPDDWEPDRAVIEQMRAECPHVDLRAEHRKFGDYWRDQPGARGRKVDWIGTWRNWIRKAAERAAPTRQSSSVAENVTGWLERAQQIESDDEGGLW
jgi:hypothetical protein